MSPRDPARRSALSIRALGRGELGLLWTIDRRERIEEVFRLEQGRLVLRSEPFDVSGWPPGEPEHHATLHAACHDRGGTFLGAFDGERLVAAAVLDTRPLGGCGDQRQLLFLHVGLDRRGQGLGTRLFEEMRTGARRAGARFLYVSATPTKRTVEFYLRRGCVLAEPDPELFALEPDDIHLLCPV